MTNSTKTSQAKSKSTKTFYVIRRGWNAANQSSRGTVANPKDTFESRLDMLVDIVDADSAEQAVEKCVASVTVYNGQYLRAVSNPRSVKGLTRAIQRSVTIG